MTDDQAGGHRDGGDPARSRGDQTRWAIAFVGQRILLLERDGRLVLPTEVELRARLGDAPLDDGAIPADVVVDGGDPARTFGLAEETEAPDGFRLEGLRAAYYGLSPDEFRAAGTARQKLEWYRSHRFCSRCGTATERHPQHEAMACPACGYLQFPRVAPAVIVLVQRGREALLGRSTRFPPGMYSTLAGFVEPGETLEDCVHREIREEVGVEVGELRYFGSQPHPFPHSLMVGFVAEWRSGDIRLDDDEIEDAGWFTPETLPELPHPMSIARALIEDFVRRVG